MFSVAISSLQLQITQNIVTFLSESVIDKFVPAKTAGRSWFSAQGLFVRNCPSAPIYRCHFPLQSSDWREAKRDLFLHFAMSCVYVYVKTVPLPAVFWGHVYTPCDSLTVVATKITFHCQIQTRSENSWVFWCLSLGNISVPSVPEHRTRRHQAGFGLV